MLFYDNLYSIIPDNDKYIIYCGNLRKAVRLPYSKMYLFKTIVDNISKMDEEEMLENYKIEKADYDSFVNQMIERGFFFEDREKLKKEDFCHRYNLFVEESKFMVAYLHVTQRCNLNCYYCYNKRNLNDGRGELEVKDWERIILSLYREGVRQFVVTGGEPTIRKDLIEILSVIPDNCKTSLLTNGTLLTGKNLDVFNYVDEVLVSLDSKEKNNNNSNRQNAENYNVLNNIERMSKEQRDKLFVRSVVTKNNKSDVQELKLYLEEKLGVKHIMSGYLPNSAEECVEFIPLKKDGKYRLKMSNMIACGAGTVEIAIDSNGDVYPCQSLIKTEFKLGNILDDDWKTTIVKAINTHMAPLHINDIEKCKACVYKYLCGGGCRAITYNIYKDINRCNEFFCEYYKEKAISNIKSFFA